MVSTKLMVIGVLFASIVLSLNSSLWKILIWIIVIIFILYIIRKIADWYWYNKDNRW
jgi:hypothetical protein